MAGHALTSRCIAFAEGSVTMVSPVLLALALKKDKWKSDVQEPALPMAMLAGATLFTGICPTLACCFSERFPTICVRLPSVIRGLAATLSSVSLLVIACWISHLGVVSESFVINVGFVAGIFLLLRTVSYMMPHVDQQLNAQAAEEAKELCSMVDKSHEFLSGITGILFLGLEALALEGLASANALLLQPHMNTSLVVCAAGVVLIFCEMVPPRDADKVHQVLYLTDIFMAVGTTALLTSLLYSMLLGPRKAGFLILFVPFMILLQLAYRLIINEWTAARGQRQAAGELPTSSSAAPPGHGGGDNQGELQDRGEEAKPAPMGLTKVTFTGFLAVSVKAISGGSPSDWTLCFLLFAAAAIVSGVSWRLLTHAQNKVKLGKAAADEAANVASFCTHLCVAVATVLFAVVACEAAAGKDQQHMSAACAHVSQVTCMHLNEVLDVQNVRNMCTCIDPCRN